MAVRCRQVERAAVHPAVGIFIAFPTDWDEKKNCLFAVLYERHGTGKNYSWRILS